MFYFLSATKKIQVFLTNLSLYIRPNSNLWILDQGWVSRYERKITGFAKFRENVMFELVLSFLTGLKPLYD